MKYKVGDILKAKVDPSYIIKIDYVEHNEYHYLVYPLHSGRRGTNSQMTIERHFEPHYGKYNMIWNFVNGCF